MLTDGHLTARTIAPDNPQTDLALVSRLISIAKTMRQLTTMKLAPIGVLAGQDQLLDALDEMQGRSVVRIAAALSVRSSTVSKMLDIFQARGWAVREADRKDLRKVLVRLTAEGIRMRSEVRAVWGSLEGELLDRLAGEKTGRTVLADMRQLEATLTARLSRLR